MLHSDPEATRGEPPPSAKPRGTGSARSSQIFSDTVPTQDGDPHPKGATAQGSVPREPRGRARQQGRKQMRAGGRKGRGGAGGRYGGGAGPLASLQPPPNFSRPLFDSLPPSGGELQSSRAGAGSPAPARPDHPRGAPTSAPPSGSRSSRACAQAPPTAAPPLSCPDSERPAPSSAAMLTPARAGAEAVR